MTLVYSEAKRYAWISREKNYLYKNLLQSNAVNSLFVVVGSENGLCAPRPEVHLRDRETKRSRMP